MTSHPLKGMCLSYLDVQMGLPETASPVAKVSQDDQPCPLAGSDPRAPVRIDPNLP
jgi:hypothetical protein